MALEWEKRANRYYERHYRSGGHLKVTRTSLERLQLAVKHARLKREADLRRERAA